MSPRADRVARCRAAALRGVAAAVLLGCGAPDEAVRLEDWIRVGVDVREEAARVEGQLVAGGFETRARVDSPRFVAFGLTHPDGRRAVRVVSRRGVVAALDSHEPDGMRTRHGRVRLVDRGEGARDVDGDGEDDVLVARDGDPTCLALLRVDEEGRASVVPDDAEALAPGGCVTAYEDVDGDGASEAVVPLAWPELGLAAPPTVDAVLVLVDGAYRARGTPAARLAAERADRLEALELARARLDVGEALRLGVELAALAHLEGASLGAQIERLDAALQGLVLSEAELDAVRAVRAHVSRGWREVEPRDMEAAASDGQEEDPG